MQYSRFSSFLLILLFVVATTACSSRDNLMRPVGMNKPHAAAVDMLVATTRKASHDNTQLFSGNRGESLSLANVVISVPPPYLRQQGTIQWPVAARPDPMRSFVTLKADRISQDEVSHWLSQKSGSKRRTVIFVHGFNNTLSEATFRFAQFSNDLGMEMAPVLFTWPSRGNSLDYAYDWESSVYSRFGLVKVIDEASVSPDVDEIIVIAHSMGAWLTMEALRQIGIRDRAITLKIKAVVLASPDIDVDVFKRQVLEMGKQRPPFLLIASRNDGALSLSRWISGGVDRLGGADLRSHKDLLAHHGITLIDTTNEQTKDITQHSAFAESGIVLDLIKEFAKKGWP